MTLLTILLGFVIASIPGALFHFWKGGSLWRLFLYLLLAWIGFWVGHFIGGAIGWTFGSYGALHIGMGLLTSIVLLGVGYWLSLVQVEKK